MPDQACKAEFCGKISSYIAYLISGSLAAIGDTMNFMNTNAAGCGVILGLMTFIVNLYYQKRAMQCRCHMLGISKTHHDANNHPHRRVDD